jgi:hypothetical protein
VRAVASTTLAVAAGTEPKVGKTLGMRARTWAAHFDASIVCSHPPSGDATDDENVRLSSKKTSWFGIPAAITPSHMAERVAAGTAGWSMNVGMYLHAPRKYTTGNERTIMNNQNEM